MRKARKKPHLEKQVALVVVTAAAAVVVVVNCEILMVSRYGDPGLGLGV